MADALRLLRIKTQGNTTIARLELNGGQQVLTSEQIHKLLSEYPNLKEHACQAGGTAIFAESIKSALLPHVVEHLAIDLLVTRRHEASQHAGHGQQDQSAQPVGLAQPAGRDQSARQEQCVQPAESAQHVQPAQPAESAQHAQHAHAHQISSESTSLAEQAAFSGAIAGATKWVNEAHTAMDVRIQIPTTASVPALVAGPTPAAPRDTSVTPRDNNTPAAAPLDTNAVIAAVRQAVGIVNTLVMYT
jgi:hypothetical protein